MKADAKLSRQDPHLEIKPVRQHGGHALVPAPGTLSPEPSEGSPWEIFQVMIYHKEL